MQPDHSTLFSRLRYSVLPRSTGPCLFSFRQRSALTGRGSGPQPFWPDYHIPGSFQLETKNFQLTGLRNLTGPAVKVSQSPPSSKKAIEAPDGEHLMETFIGYQ
ncbi:uncharacterized protein AKAW2_50236A [Aspergillus luchuensis]|uniref:Uncharacterized protein n=1 Tax=Aspergillus kawachii TaxID=1069201 RepID=A0A7R7WBY8_ASPKA|nr:uncharacterized protein AKAW2_50236A [Aspergillus luchuensis]BCR99894.1 hypothetical protein AKAW2_50236A [Aspergillus luchuensis]